METVKVTEDLDRDTVFTPAHYGRFLSSLISVKASSCVTKPVTQYSVTQHRRIFVQGGSNMTGTDLYVNKSHCAAAVRP